MLELSLDDVKLDGSYHRLKVKVDREGLQLQACRGYHAPKAERKPGNRALTLRAVGRQRPRGREGFVVEPSNW